ncbi:MAG: adenylyl-sulfate reductase subunit alpha [Treponema sp.]|nr:adenylyl-sulfate reductase subunit alpha [Treponema sp.]
MNTETIQTDVLIIGGGTAGCYAAITLAKNAPALSVLVAEKANIERSGCLAAGVNALNAYITPGHTPQDYADYAANDAEGIARGDLLLSLSERLNAITADLEKRGLVILKDEHGNYVSRGWRNIKINGENIKPILAQGVRELKNVRVINHLNITDLETAPIAPVSEETALGTGTASTPSASSTGTPGASDTHRVTGAFGFDVNDGTFYHIHARAVLIATGGAAGLYRPNNPGFSRHKMWYPPFNTGAGYAMGLLAGAEMTTFEMRFIALRCKDTIAPTGTIAQGVHAKQVNASGDVYETRYGLKTSERVWGTVEENRAGRGPCYLATKGITAQAEQDLYKAYLNMAPSQTLKWIEAGKGPASANVEIEGTEPYIVGGHTASGFWVSTGRETTVSGLFAAGDVAGGAPQKYVTGALAEGEIAAESIARYLAAQADFAQASFPQPADSTQTASAVFSTYESHFSHAASEKANKSAFSTEQLEEAMQKIMDEYAGGISSGYRYNEARLSVADREIAALQALVPALPASDADDLLRIYELRERLIVCRAVIAHLAARKETRWHSFGENADYPEKSADGECYINSVWRDGAVQIIRRPLNAETVHPCTASDTGISGGRYEHKN